MGHREFTPVWELYGLRSNPFTVFPLSVKGGNLPIEKAFFGREEGIRRLKNYFASGDSRVIVCGEPGVGKTSFVNFVRAHASKSNFFTNFKEIDLQPGWKKEHFIINSLVSIHSTIKLLGLSQKLSSVSDKLEVLFTLTNTSEKHVSVSAFSFGFGLGSDRTISQPQMSETYLENLFAETIEGLIAAGYKGIILHFNNVSVNEAEGFSEKEIKVLFNNIRDILLTEKTHFVFVTDLNVPPILETQQRVSSILQDSPIRLDPMSKESVKDIISKRFELLKEPELAFTLPVKDDTIDLLYKLYGGNIRYILNSLSAALLELVSEAPVTLDKYSLARILSNIAKERFFEKLSKREQQVLLAILETDEATNKVLANKTGLHSQNISTYLTKLQKTNCVYLHHKEGTHRYYRATGHIKWLLLNGSGADASTVTGDLTRWMQ